MTTKDAGLVTTHCGTRAVCVEEQSRSYGWVLYKHRDGQWVTERRALPHELQRAIEIHKSHDTEPQRG